MPYSVEDYQRKRDGILSERAEYQRALAECQAGVEKCDRRLAELDAAQKEAQAVP